MEKFIFSKVASTTFSKKSVDRSLQLKTNFFIGIFQEFWLPIPEHLFSRTFLR